MSAARVRSFPPVARADARVLILGSMPGQASLTAGQYYAHPQNQFWPLIERIFDVPRALPYEARLQGLQHNGVALWDVLQSCQRAGSLDADIEMVSAVPNALPALLRGHARIERICCNGGTAWRAVQRYFGPTLREQFPCLTCLKLPSTSPAHAGMRLPEKLAAWRVALRGG